VTSYTNSFFGIPEGDTRFNLPAAVDTYEWVMANPEISRVVLSKMLYDYVPQDIKRHRVTVDAVTRSYIAKRISQAKRGLSRNVSKSAAAGAALEAMEAISKAYGDDREAAGGGLYNEFERAANAAKQRRDAEGRWVVMNRKVNPQRQTVPMNLPMEVQARIPDSQISLQNGHDERRRFQGDYQEIRDMLASAATGRNPDTLDVIARLTSGDTIEMPYNDALAQHNDQNDANNGLVRTDNAVLGRHVDSVKVTDRNPPAFVGPYFDTLSGMTSPRFADHAMAVAGAAGGGPTDPDWQQSALGSAERRWNWRGADDDRTNDQFWRRMGAASALASDIGGPYIPPSAQFALRAGKWVGDIAPEAEKVIGPTARKAGYRYRGTEKKPDPYFQMEINNIRRKHDTATDKNGQYKAQPGRDAHVEMLRGVAQSDKRPDGSIKEWYEPSPIIEMFKDMLPDAQRYHLNRKAGTIPPSQGIIIDRKGKVTTEAVGYGEDWYVPFNLSNLGALDGGEYVRTRAFGGPTTEDVYVGIMTGARAVTVVSHSGVFTLEFDDTFRGSRRYNDKAGRMVERYGQLLDAVKSREVRLGQVSPARYQEIANAAAEKFRPDISPDAYEKEFHRLVDVEMRSPRLSEAEKDEVRTRLLNERISEQGKYPDYEQMVWEAEATAAETGDSSTLQRIITPAKAIDYMGLSQRASKEIADEQARYENELNPLDINGRGYYQALKGLQDQFPYYVKDVIHTDFNTGAQDFGYVKPNYNRPEGALSGYYDPTITGKGKITADRTNYQNYPSEKLRSANEARRGVNPYQEGLIYGEGHMPSVPSSSGVAPAAPAAPALGGFSPAAPAPVRINKGEALANIYLNIVAQRTVPNHPTSPGAPWTHNPDDPVTGVLFKSSPISTAYLLRNNPDSDEAKAIRTAIDKVIGSGWFDLDRKALRDYQGDSAALPQPQNIRAAFDALNLIEQGQTFDFPDITPGQSYNQYVGIIAGGLVAAKLDAEPDDDSSDLIGRAKDKAAELKAQQAIHDAMADGQDVARGPSMSEDDIRAQLWGLLRIAQAAKMRDDVDEEEGATIHVVDSDEEARELRRQLTESTGALPKDEAPAQGATKVVPGELNERRIEALQAQVHAKIGMDKVATQVDDLVDEAYIDRQRMMQDPPLKPSNRTRHLVFVGNPGTGKTTIADIIAPIYKELGILETGQVIKKKRQDLISKWAGETEQNVQDAFDEARGGILIFDEAYALKTDDRDHVGQTAIDTINDLAEERRGDTVVILMGYPGAMEQFLAHNAGLASRFPSRITFPDYTASQMREIADQMIEESDFKATDRGVKSVLKRAINVIASEHGHGNARDVRELIGKIGVQQKRRLRREGNASPSREDLMRIKSEDVKAAMDEWGKPLPSPRKKAA
jgi:stage V sporulation protein K